MKLSLPRRPGQGRLRSSTQCNPGPTTITATNHAPDGQPHVSPDLTFTGSTVNSPESTSLALTLDSGHSSPSGATTQHVLQSAESLQLLPGLMYKVPTIVCPVQSTGETTRVYLSICSLPGVLPCHLTACWPVVVIAASQSTGNSFGLLRFTF